MTNPDERQQRIDELLTNRYDRYPTWDEVQMLVDQVTDLQQQLEVVQKREYELVNVDAKRFVQLKQARQLLERLRIFCRRVLDAGPAPNIAEDLDGGDLQDWALEAGLLVPTTVTEPCATYCACAEWDDFPQTCYRFADFLTPPTPEETVG